VLWYNVFGFFIYIQKNHNLMQENNDD